MRNLVTERITELLVLYPHFQNVYDISIDELHTLSNEELLDLYTGIVGEDFFG